MGLFEKIFPRPNNLANADTYFKTLYAYRPAFTSWGGALYESELVRAAIDAKARHISKLRVEFQGAAQPKLQTAMRVAPNDFQTWGQFLYRLETILEMQNTAFIVPILDRYQELHGYYPLLPSKCEIIDYAGQPWLRYKFSTGDIGAVELKRCGVLTKYQYRDDFFGENNSALNPTMQLITIQNQGIQEGIKSAASFRFMAKLTNFKSPEDMKKEQKAFNETNFSADAGGGVALFPSTYTDIQQIKSSPFTVDAEQMKLIQTNVYNYFGVNEEVLQNKAIGDSMDAFFEGAIEPFSVQLSDVMTNMTFSNVEQSYGAKVVVTANRLHYMSTSIKIQLAQQLGDRGMVTINEIRELFDYAPIEGGEKAPIRGEYYMVGDEKEEQPKEDDNDGN